MEIRDVLQPPVRSKQITQRQLKTLRSTMLKLPLPAKQQIIYNLANKQSKSGFFNNERLFILNTKQKELFYVSKVPEGLIPFLNQGEVNSLKFKSKITRQAIVKAQIQNFKCGPAAGKPNTLEIRFKKGKEEDSWILIFANKKLMNDWVDLINKTLTRDQPRPKTPEKNNTQIPKPQPLPIIKQPQPVILPEKPIMQSKKILNQNTNVSHPQPLQAKNINQQYIPNTITKEAPSQIDKGEQNTENKNALNNQSLNNSSYVSQGIEESKIANLPYSDHVSELKYLKKQKPTLFNTTNVLSTTKIVPAQQKQSYEQINRNQQTKSKGSLPKRQYHQNIENSKAQSLIKDSKAQSRFYQMPLQNSNDKGQTKPVFQQEKQIYNRNNRNSQMLTDQIPRSKIGLSRVQEPILFKSPQQPKMDIRDEYNLVNSKIEVQKSPLIKNNSAGNSRNRLNGQISHVRQQKQLNKQHSSNYLNVPTNSQNYTSKNRIESEDDTYKANRHTQSHLKQESAFIKNSQSVKKVLKQPQEQKMIMRRSGIPVNSMNKKGTNVSSRRTFNRKKWNEIFAETSNKLDVYQQFVQTSHNIVREIVNELPLDKNQKEYLPVEINSPYFTYYDEGIVITLHYFQNNSNLATTSDNRQDMPLLYDQSTFELLKREFYNLNLILSVTSNEGFIKVPLCAYFQYKGVIALCKAEIPETFTQASPKKFEKQFDIIQNQIHVRFMYGSFNSYVHPNYKYIIVDNMRQLIPQIPISNKQQHYFRKQFLLGYQHIIEDLQTCNQAHQYIIDKVLPEFLGKLQSLETYVVNSKDLQRICHDSGLSLAYLSSFTQQTKSPFLKKIFISEIVSVIFVSIFRSEINHLMAYFPFEQISQINIDSINGIILQACHSLIQMMFSYSNAAETIWKMIVEQCSVKYKLTISKQDIIAGYLFGSIIQRIGLACDFRRSTFNKHKVQFFVKSGNIPKDLLTGFKVKIRRYDLSSISPLVRDIEEMLYSQPSPTNFKSIVQQLNLRQESIPAFLEPIQPLILTYLCNFVPYSQHEQFQHIGIYNMIVLQPHSYYSTKSSLLAVKWCIKKSLSEQAYKIYEMKQIENAFWLGQYNPAISQFYDFFSMYNASIGKYDQSIQLAKLSLKNIIKILGVNELPVADKHYQLGNIYFKMGRKEQSIKEYTRTKEILVYHGQVHIAEYGIILLKLAVLYLNFGRITECVNNSLEALKIFERSQDNEQNTIGTFQILARCYEISKKNSQLINIGNIIAEQFNFTQDIQIFQRMAKIVLYNRLKNISSAESKAFVSIISKLQSQNSRGDPIEAFTFLHKKSRQQILMKKAIDYLDNIVSLYEQASRKDLFRRYKSLDYNTRTQAEQMLVIFDALGILIGYGYMMGSLKDSVE